MVFFSRSFLANTMKGTNISICSMRLKSFLPQAWSHIFVFSVFLKFCCLFQSLIVTFKWPGLANLIKNTPSFICCGYLESILHRPQLQCLVAPFLLIRFLFPSLVLSIFLRLSTAFKILYIFVHISITAFNCGVSQCHVTT